MASVTVSKQGRRASPAPGNASYYRGHLLISDVVALQTAGTSGDPEQIDQVVNGIEFMVNSALQCGKCAALIALEDPADRVLHRPSVAPPQDQVRRGIGVANHLDLGGSLFIPIYERNQSTP